MSGCVLFGGGGGGGVVGFNPLACVCSCRLKIGHI